MRVLTAAGWGTLVLTIMGLVLVLTGGWPEAQAVAWAGALVLLLCLAQVMAPSNLRVSLTAPQDRAAAGQEVHVELHVTNRSSRPSGAATIEIPWGQDTVRLRVPAMRPHTTTAEEIGVVAHRRELLRIGPAQAVRTDLLRLIRRVRTWGSEQTVHVHPRTLRSAFEAVGFQLDVEGTTTSRLSSSDVSFRALRDYEPGDDQRQVHWASSARLGRLMVRQYEETRRSHHLIIIDTDSRTWDAEDFETAVSVAASLARADLARSRQVSLRAGDAWLPTERTVALLDALTELTLSDQAPQAQDMTAVALAQHPDASVMTVLVPASTSDAQATALIALAGPDMRTQVVRTGAPQPRRRAAGAGLVLDCSRLEDLPRLMSAQVPS